MIDRLQKVQNKIIKILFGNGLKKTSELYKENKILKIIELRDYIIITTNYYSNKFKNCNLNRKGRLRNNKPTYEIPRWNNKYGQRNKGWYIPNIFNKVPKNMLNFTTVKELKLKLKEHMTQNNG